VNNPSVLILGAAVGRKSSSLWRGESAITAVEINPLVVQYLKNDFAAF